MSTSDIQQAREWAEDVRRIEAEYGSARPDALAGARIIESLPDTVVDGDKLREVIADWGNREVTSDAYTLYRQVLALLPTPSLPTLADMTPEEREACQWMQAIYDPDSGYTDGTVVIAQIKDDRAVIMWDDGSSDTRYHQHITPLPGRPRMVWPDEQATEEDMSIIPPEIDTSGGHDDHVDMTPEDVPEGEPWVVEWYGLKWVGVRNGTNIGSSGTIWSLVSMEDSRTRWGHDSEITLVSRLVPEVKP